MTDVYVTDTVAVRGNGGRRLHVVSIAPVIAAAIGRFIADGSLGDLF